MPEQPGPGCLSVSCILIYHRQKSDVDLQCSHPIENTRYWSLRLKQLPVVTKRNCWSFFIVTRLVWGWVLSRYNTKGPVAEKGSIALEATMVTKQAPTSQHHHTERVQWNTCNNPYLPMQGWEEWEQKPEDISSHEFAMTCLYEKSKARQSWDMQSHVSSCSLSGHPAQACLAGAQPLTR